MRFGAVSSDEDVADPSTWGGGAASLSGAWPVGSIFISAVSTNPATLLGFGTWSAFAAGRVLVGLDSGQTEFDTVEETGGSKTHTLTSSEMPSHTHTQNSHNHTQDSHNHTQDSHNHTQDAHTHTQNSHVHTQQRNNTTTGANSGWTTAFDTSSSSPQADSGTGTGSTTATNQNTTATNQATTATNQAQTATNQAATATNQNTGGDGAHNNLQPYIVVYMWKRTA